MKPTKRSTQAVPERARVGVLKRGSDRFIQILARRLRERLAAAKRVRAEEKR